LTDEQHLQVGAAIHRRLWRRTRPQFAWAVDARFTDDDLSLLRAELNKIAITVASISDDTRLASKPKSSKAVCRAGVI
jgi:hypothetical protein